MSRIRDATPQDINAILALGYEAHARGVYRHVPVDETKFRKLCVFLMASRQHKALVATRGGDVVGVLLGVTDEIFFSRKKSATDVLTYTNASGAGCGRRLVKAFVEWAQAQPGVYQIVLSVSAGIVEGPRVDRVYRQAGLEPVGASYAWYRGDEPPASATVVPIKRLPVKRSSTSQESAHVQSA